MNNLKTMNAQKSLEIIRDFVEASVTVEDIGTGLKEKRQEAVKALAHLENIFEVKSKKEPYSCRAGCDGAQR